MDKNKLKEIIKTFINRAVHRDSLGYTDILGFDRLYNDFKVDMSFGQGNFANKPWLAFLKNGNRVNNGIYPTISYFYEHKKLVVGKGVSDQNIPTASWKITTDDIPWSDMSLGDTCVNCYYREIFDLEDIDNLTEDMLEKIVTHINKIMLDFPYENNNLTNMVESPINNMQTKNIILYGPPGVGKTYNHKKLISLIESGENQKEIFDAIVNNDERVDNALFEKVKEENRFKFVTFHQSYSYEDFIEGFRPQENGNIELVDGIFKEIADKARKNLEDATKESVFDFEQFLSDYIEEVEENINYEIEDGLTVQVRKKTNGDFQSFIVGGRIQGQSLTKDIIRRDFEDFLEGNILSSKDVKPSYESQSIAHGNAPYYFKLYQNMKKFLDKHGKNYTSNQVEQKNFYLLIDEINRGNISKIFGELITLIEDDKRDEIEVTLPYSKEPFKVPSNLYIIATMNSTDKSIALIDVALRRRFTFLKMQPDESLIEDIKAKEIFRKLNDFIRVELGEDYLMGHSYFMGEALDLDFVLEYKIKPLMEEYFYGDEKGLNEVLDIVRS